MLYNKDSVETSRTEMSEESQDTVESASPNRESLCSTMTPGIDAKINDVIEPVSYTHLTLPTKA